MLIEQPWNIELVEWEDAASWHGPLRLRHDKDELAGGGLMKCKTVGFLVFEDDKEVKVAHCHSALEDPDNEAVAYVQCIPKAWIQKRTRLEPATRPRNLEERETETP